MILSARKPRILTSGIIALGVIFGAAFLAIALYAIAEVHSMAGELARVDSRLGTLSTMNQKLDELQNVSGKLSTMKLQLSRTNSSLQDTNRLLARTNAKIDATNANLSSTEKSIVSLSSIRGDIHEMSRKISGSFLFRGVK